MVFIKGHKLWKHPNAISSQFKKGRKIDIKNYYRERKCLACGKEYKPRNPKQKCCKEKECVKKIKNIWKEKNKKRIRENSLKNYYKYRDKKLARNKKYNKSPMGKINKTKNRYKISKEEYELLIKLNSKCKICEREWSESVRKCIDHNHQTNRIRGLLCFNCNAILGHAHDNIETLKNAIKYLEEDNGKLQ